MNRTPPNGHFIRDFIVWGSLKRSSTVSRGFIITPPDLRGAGAAAAAAAHESLVKYLQSINPNIRLQWQWRCNSDYHVALDAYDKATATLATNPREKQLRESTSRHFRGLLTSRKLRREHLVLFVSQTLQSAPPLSSPSSIKSYYTAVFSQLETTFEQYRAELCAALGSDVAITPMTKRDHQLYCFLFFNPGANEWQTLDRVQFEADKSILHNCLNSDITAGELGRMFLDGHYHAFLILRNLGSHSYEGMIQTLTKTAFLDYQITVTLTPLDTYAIIAREETEQQHLQNQENADTVVSQTRRDTIRRKQETISQLGEGHTRRYNVTFVVRVWNADPAKLAADVNALKQALIAMKGARVYDTHLPATTLETFFSTFPGNTFHPYTARAVEIDDTHVANLIPYSASFTGDLAHAQALFHSSDGALVGFRFHVNGLVQHTGVAGGTRAGKSVVYNNTLYQTGPYFAYDVMVEEGASHTNYTEDHGCKPIVIQKSGAITINYLDTGGTPLDPDHLAYAISLTSHFAGSTTDERLASRRRAYLSYYLGVLYHEAYLNWLNHHAELEPVVYREAAAIYQWHRTRMTADDTLFDAYTLIRERAAANDGEILEFIAKIPEAEITHFLRDSQTAHIAERHAFSKFNADEFPRHSDLAELMRFRAAEEHDRGEVSELATLMENWCATGEYGPLFDGVTNRRFDGRVVHFELAKADNSDAALRGAIALNITGRIRQQIVTMPRALPKRFTMEELARLIQMPGGVKLTLELSAQLAKYNCLFAFILQDFSQIAHIPGIAALLTNTRQWLIARHDDEKELGLFAERIRLPDSMRSAIADYPIPLNLPPAQRHSAMCYFSRAAVPQISGSVHYSFAQNTHE